VTGPWIGAGRDPRAGSTSARPARSPRLDSLTALRWWAAFAVFLHHSTNLVPLPAHGLISLGAQGVAFFFVLSGFVLSWSWSPRVSTTTFWSRRFARIWPAHVVALALAIPVFYSVDPDPVHSWVKPFSAVLVLSVVLLQGWASNPTVVFSGNPAAWTLSLEAFFYATHPLLHRILLRVGRQGAQCAVVALPVVAAALYLARAAGVPGLEDLPRPVLRLWEFALGMALAQAVRLGWRPRVPVPLAVAVLGVAAVGIWAGPHVAAAAWTTLRVGVLAPVIVPVVCALLIVASAVRELRHHDVHADDPGAPRPPGTAPVLVRLGEWSYAFYLVHATVIYALRGVLGQAPVGWGNALYLPPLLAVCVVVAWALHAWVERPAERRMRRWKDRRDTRRRGRGGGEPALSVPRPERRP
jgi:peptidoglycan/LPS O-acetylase OafA/YrhL